ncbi:MAG: ABC transporter substrate-binding protein, partial [Oscillospiraceae bacterium]|nr:ABC transporter substrate-binding protein [Oscillospiraceae bacterium]
MKKLIALMMILVLSLSLAACGKKEEDVTPEPEPEKKILRMAESFAYASLDAHKDWNGWYTSIYGMTETLFKVGNDLSVQPLLATKAETSEDGLTWTITLTPKATFSNGKAVTADMVIRNLQRIGEVNDRFHDVSEYVLTKIDDTTFTITT